MERVSMYLVDLTAFIEDHRAHGGLTGQATPPAWNGYRLTAVCRCGVAFERWVTPWDAELDRMRMAGLN